MDCLSTPNVYNKLYTECIHSGCLIVLSRYLIIVSSIGDDDAEVSVDVFVYSWCFSRDVLLKFHSA